MQSLHCFVADTSAWFVDDTLESQIIILLRNEPQVGVCISNFGAFIETRATDDAVGNAKVDETIFKLAHLERGADKNSHVAEQMFVA